VCPAEDYQSTKNSPHSYEDFVDRGHPQLPNTDDLIEREPPVVNGHAVITNSGEATPDFVAADESDLDFLTRCNVTRVWSDQ